MITDQGLHLATVVLAVLVAVLGGIFEAAGATRVGWEYARPLTTG